jgi:hypothetical protein
MLTAPRAAEAYVRYKTSAGAPFAWPQTCVPVTVYPNDLPDLTPDQTMHAVSAAAAAWSAEQNACTYLKIQVGSSMAAAPTASYDGRNSVIFRRTSWCRAGELPGTCSYDPAALAITSVFVSNTDGKIRDADIEVNAKNFVWTDLDLHPADVGKADLQNVLTHEMGHLIGLAGSCVTDGTLPRPVDNAGQPVPDCGSASATVRATTMFEASIPGEVSKRTLAPDDIQAVCDSYPKAQDPAICPVAGADAGTDAAPFEAGADSGTDASPDSGSDAIPDAEPDTVPPPKDAGPDAVMDGAAGHTGTEAGASGGRGAEPAAAAAGCGCAAGRGSPGGSDVLAIAGLIYLLARKRRWRTQHQAQRLHGPG